MGCCCCTSLIWATVVVGIVIYLFNRWYRKAFVKDLANKHVFITGCDSGFGHRLAVDLDGLDVNVYAGCLTEEGAEQLKKKCSKKLKTVLINVTDQESIDKARDFVQNDLPSGKNLWGLVNNAGILGNLIFELSVLDDYKQVMDVNFFGPIRVNEAFIPLIKKSKGRMVQLASIAGRGTIATSAYACSKHAVEPYTDELRRFMSAFNVRVSTIEPGCFVQTNILNEKSWVNIVRRRYEEVPSWRKVGLNVEREIEMFKMMANDFPLANYNDIGMVTGAITHALFSQHPKSRYVVGYDARPFVLFLGWAPDWLIDAFVRLLRWSGRSAWEKAKKSS